MFWHTLHKNRNVLHSFKIEFLDHFIKKSKIFFIFSQNRHSSVLLKNFFIFSQNGKFSPAHFIKSVIFFYLNQNRNFLKISYIHLDWYLSITEIFKNILIIYPKNILDVVASKKTSVTIFLYFRKFFLILS